MRFGLFGAMVLGDGLRAVEIFKLQMANFLQQNRTNGDTFPGIIAAEARALKYSLDETIIVQDGFAQDFFGGLLHRLCGAG
jgi:hypothetical protein